MLKHGNEERNLNERREELIMSENIYYREIQCGLKVREMRNDRYKSGNSLEFHTKFELDN